jgi:hypothetical protein
MRSTVKYILSTANFIPSSFKYIRSTVKYIYLISWLHHKFYQILSVKNKISVWDKALQMKLFFIFADSMGD